MSPSRPHPRQSALEDRLYFNCRVMSLESPGPRPRLDPARAILVRSGRVVAVGEEEQLWRLAAPGALRIDCDGSWLLPAFHDSHVHLAQHGFELSQVELHSAPDLGEGLRRVADRAAELPKGSWILGAGFALQRWGLTTLSRELLDSVAPDHPVLLRSQDLHSAWVNSLALSRAGVSAATPDPPNGTIVRGERGEPTGLLLERALHLIWDSVPEPGPKEIARAVRLAGADLAARGIATVHHMAYEPPEYWREIASASSHDDFPLRVWACIHQEDIEHAKALGLASGQGGANFTVGGAKFFVDGALGSRTAWMLEPYAGTNDLGVAIHGSDVLAERFPLAIAARLAPVTHAIGDAAGRAVLDALEGTVAQWQPLGLRPRLEHAQHLTDEDARRAAALGVVVSMQPAHLTFDVASIAALLPDRRDRAYRWGSLLEYGAPLAFGSDTPVASPDVFAGLRAACTRLGADGETLCPDQSLTPYQALYCYTRGAAYAIGREDRSGQLAPGFDADLVLLSHNPLESFDDLKVRGTVKGGEATFDPEGLLAARYTRA